MRTILVPTDFSPNAHKALDFAVRIAKKANASIQLVHAFTGSNEVYGAPDATTGDINQVSPDLVERQLLTLKESIESAEDLEVKTQSYPGPVREAILLACAADAGVDLVVMGTLGLASPGLHLFGSNTAGVIGKSNVPVLAIPFESEWKPIEKILLAVNHFEEADITTNPVFDLARLFDASVSIAFFTELYSEHEDVTKGEKARILAYVAALQVSHPGTPISATHVKGHLFQPTIEEHISRTGFDIVAMVTHKRTFLQGLFNGSMTKKMSYNLRTPLLAVPA